MEWRPSRMVGVSASVNLPLHHKVRSSLLAPAHLGAPGKRAIKRWWWCGGIQNSITLCFCCFSFVESLSSLLQFCFAPVP